jgi:hypothetical protein
MMASRGMGAIMPSKMPGGVKKPRRDDTDFTQYAEGGEVESKFEPVKPSYGVKAMGASGEMGSGAGGRFTVQKNLGKDLDLEAYLEGQAFKPKGMSSKGAVTGGGVKLTKRFAKGGKTESKVNQAGVYTKPELRKRIVSQVKAAATHGTGAGQWSARKAQLVAKKYKAAGGGYRD